MRLFLVFFSLILSCCSPRKSPLEGESNKELLVLGNRLKMLIESNHLNKPNLNQLSSDKFFNKFLEQVDPGKELLTKEDVSSLRGYSESFLEQMLLGNLVLVRKTEEIIISRYKLMAEVVVSFLEKKIEYKKNTYIETSSKKREYVSNVKDLKSFWENQLLLDFFSKKLNSEFQEKGTKKTQENFTEEELRKKITDIWTKYIQRQLKKLENKEEISAITAKFYNAIIEIDPHTNYLPPIATKDFSQSMRGEFEGIGAVLSEKNNYVYIEEVLPGGPAFKSKKITKGDKILTIISEDNVKTDAFGLDIHDTIALIKGKKGSKVTIVFEKLSGEVFTTVLVRDIIPIEDSLVKTTLIKTSSGEEIAYIVIPKFYRDLDHLNGKNCSDDLKKDLQRIASKKLKGIILDVRNNLGGSLEDAMKISQFFLGKVPTVQVKDFKGIVSSPSPQVQEGPLYKGPLLVLTNYLTASAPEILSAALQDYKRAIIVGGQETHGKGTVQTFVELSNRLFSFGSKDSNLGALKVTVQKFYRVNGSTTQMNGVIPDIKLPDIFTAEEMGERFYPNAIGSSTISSLNYKTWDLTNNISSLQKKSTERVSKNTTFKTIDEIITWYKEQKKSTKKLLSYEVIKKNYLERKKFSLEDQDEKQEISSFMKSLSFQEITPSKKEKPTFDKLQKDAYLEEALYILDDYVKLL